MPIIVDVLKVPYKYDGRRKITDEQKQSVRRMYEVENAPIRKISRDTGVSRRSVQFILFPERLQVVKDRAKEVKRWEKYNTPEYHTPAIKKNRAKKKLLLKNNLIKVTPENLTKHNLICEKNAKRGRDRRKELKY